MMSIIIGKKLNTKLKTMRNREEYNAYMKAYQQRKRDNMTFEEWRAFRDKNNAYHKKRYDNRTPEQIEKNREYQRQKQKLYYWMKNKDNESDKVPTTQPG
jgi:cell fate (sporulation/competence/biofilm development) regulator YlbF (YheA/YmcA/DUF963 family)